MSKKMTHASVFSGIGGPEIAATLLGWDNVFHCEINPFGRKVLEYWYPNSKSYEDITKTDFSEWRGRVNVLSGGFPCQPFSYAGQRRGATDDRYLWPYMFKCIDQVRPDWVVCENVAGILTMVEQGEVSAMDSQATLFGEADGLRRYRLRETFTLQRICDDLEQHGYEVQPVLVPACAVGAPHRRDRVFIVGHNALTDTDRRADGRGAGENEGESRKERLQERDEIRLADQPSQVRPAGERNADADTTQQRSDGARFELEQSEAGRKKQGKSRGSSRSNGSEWLDAYAGINGLQGVLHGEGDEDAQRKGQTSPLTTDAIGSIQPGKCWRDFPLVSPVHRRNDGLPFNVDDLTISYNKWRNETLKAYGNAIVPQVMYEIFRTIESVENGTYDTTNGL